MQNQCNLNVRSKCILNALRIRKGNHLYDFSAILSSHSAVVLKCGNDDLFDLYLSREFGVRHVSS